MYLFLRNMPNHIFNSYQLSVINVRKCSKVSKSVELKSTLLQLPNFPTLVHLQTFFLLETLYELL